MLLSIIIPAKNEEGHIGRVLKDIRHQSYKDIEVIVADARSTDDTRKIAKRYGAMVIKGGMPGEGRNAGVYAAKGEALLFLDADVRLPGKHFIRDMLTEVRQRQLDIAACKVMPSDGGRGDRMLHRMYNLYIRLSVTLNPHAAGACIFAKKHVHDSIGGFDESITLAEDVDYVKRGSQVGQFGILKQPPVQISIRRLKKEGRAKMAMKYVKTEAHILTKGPVRDNDIPYDYEYGDEKNT
jgi:glycosyltransferase involved in cell wall biosynthesis